MEILYKTLLYFFLTVLIHSISCHLIRKYTIFSKFMIIGICLGLIMTTKFYCNYKLNNQTIAAVMTYAFLCELYIFTFTFISSSVSVSILLHTFNGYDDLNTVSKRYCGKIMVSDRIKRMHKIELVKNNNDCISITPKGINLIQKIHAIQKLFSINEY